VLIAWPVGIIVLLARQPTAVGIVIPGGDACARAAGEGGPIRHFGHSTRIIVAVADPISARAVLALYFSGEPILAGDGGAVRLRDRDRLQAGIISRGGCLRSAASDARASSSNGRY